MTAIVDIIGREILDSRSNPTVEVDVVLEDHILLGREVAEERCWRHLGRVGDLFDRGCVVALLLD